MRCTYILRTTYKNVNHDYHHNAKMYRFMILMISICAMAFLYVSTHRNDRLFLLSVPHLKLYGGSDSCNVWCSNCLMKLALAQLRWKVTAACHFHRSCWTDLARSIQVDQNPSIGIDPRNVPGRTRHCVMHSKIAISMNKGYYRTHLRMRTDLHESQMP